MRKSEASGIGDARSANVSWPAIGREVAIALFAFFVYFGVRGLTEARVDRAVSNGEAILRFERWLGIAWESSWQDAILQHDWLVTLFNWIYMFGHWPVIAVTAFWLVYTQPRHYRLIRNAFLVSGAIGLVIFALFPAAPPRLLEAGLVDTVTERSRSYRVLQPPVFVNQYAAMPSLHFGWNLLIGIALVLYAKPLVVRVIGVILPIAMFASVVLTANHYIVDPLAGGIVALFGLWVAWRIDAAEHAQGEPAPVPLRPATTGGDRMRRTTVLERPLSVAHRAGNELHLLRQAEEIGVDLIEADVRYWRGRIEVRHLKTMGPVPFLWDRWVLRPAWRHQTLLLEDLLPRLGPRTELMLDFKPGDAAYAHQVLQLMREIMPGRQYTVCSQSWELLECFAGEPGVRVVHSVGNRRLLKAVLPHLRNFPEETRAISIHRKLLTPSVVAELRAEVPLVMSWPVNDDHTLRRLESWGVNGFIVDDMGLLRRLVEGRLGAPSGTFRRTASEKS